MNKLKLKDLFNKTWHDVVVTDLEEGPKGWIKETVRDVNIFFDPKAWTKEMAEDAALQFDISDGDRMTPEDEEPIFWAEVYSTQFPNPDW
jgi:hypothetical protein